MDAAGAQIAAARKDLAHAEAQLAEQTARARNVERAAGQLRTDLTSAQAKLAALAQADTAPAGKRWV